MDIKRIQQRYSIIGASTTLLSAIERAITVAPIDLSVLIIGESGVGKEHFPRIIHDNSPRKHKQYIAVNCGAIPEGTIDSELFGHVKGAFTGADYDHKGYFEEADKGTIFLDEIAEMPLSTQARLLRVLESGEFLRVGSSKVQKADVRIVAATNKDLVEAVKQGRFREDLYYRISTVQINVPPLRERGGRDIMLLASKFCNDFSVKYGTPLVQFSSDGFAALESYPWPGNVRQLKNVVEQIALFEANKGVADGKTVANHIPVKRPGANVPAVIDSGNSQHNYTREREIIFKILWQLESEVKELKQAFATGKQSTSRDREVHLTSNVAELRRDTVFAEEVNNPTVHLQQGNDNHYRPTHNSAPQRHDDEPQVHDITALPVDDDVRHAAPQTLEEIERRTITDALDRNNGRRRAAAEELGISERTLYRKIKEYGLEGRNHRG